MTAKHISILGILIIIALASWPRSSEAGWYYDPNTKTVRWGSIEVETHVTGGGPLQKKFVVAIDTSAITEVVGRCQNPAGKSRMASLTSKPFNPMMEFEAVDTADNNDLTKNGQIELSTVVPQADIEAALSPLLCKENWSLQEGSLEVLQLESSSNLYACPEGTDVADVPTTEACTSESTLINMCAREIGEVEFNCTLEMYLK